MDGAGTAQVIGTSYRQEVNGRTVKIANGRFLRAGMA